MDASKGMLYDLVVIGGGSGGVRAARTAASLGARVALVEEHRVGGTCVIRGCVPKKLMVMAGRFAADFADARGFGWTVDAPTFSWGSLVNSISEEIRRLEALYRKGLQDAGATIIDDRAVIEGPGTVRLQRADAAIESRNILIATGGAPAPLDLPGQEHCITSDDVFTLPRQPERIVILGGGYIAVELAGVFKALGSDVTIVHRAPTLLRGFDHDLQEGVKTAYLEAGIHLFPQALATRIEKLADGFAVHDSAGTVHLADAVLNATGRRPKTASLGLERVGVALDRDGAIVVDTEQRTSMAGIFAVGDVTNELNLTPVALRQGQALAESLFGGAAVSWPDFRNAPTAVFSTPELATVGLTEHDARLTYPGLKVFKTRFRPMRATLAKSSERMVMKVLVDSASDRLLGIHLLGREAAEMIQMIAVAFSLGATKRDLDRTLALHPTMAEELVTMKLPT